MVCDLSVVNGDEINTQPDQVDANNFSNFQTPYMLDLYMDEACLDGFSFDGMNLFDDSLYYSILNDLELFETNMMYDLPALEDTIGAPNYQYVESSEEVHEQIPDSSWFNSICHQAKPVSEELDVKSCQFDSERVDYADQEIMVKNFLEVSDESNLLPALVSKETRKTKRVTLVLDLDGNYSSALSYVFLTLSHLNLQIPKMYDVVIHFYRNSDPLYNDAI